MFYVYRSTTEKIQTIAEFTDLDQAMRFIKYHAIREIDENCTGYQVEDATCTLRGGYEL